MRHLSPLLVITACALPAFAATTFHENIEPLLQNHCQSCHRAGEIGPMPLMTYQQARPWAAAILESVRSKKMPPWFADPGTHQKYKDDLSLTPDQVETIEKWIKAGAPEGEAKNAPAPRTFVEGWNIGKPDRIVEMPQAYRIPSTGTVEYTYIIIPSGLTQDAWVRAAEIRPGNRALMHHAILFTRTPGSKWLRDYPIGVPFVPAPRPGTTARFSDGDRIVEGSLADEWLVGYAPGIRPFELPDDTAYLVKAGSDFVLQLHYTPRGQESTDLTRIGLVFSKQRPSHRALVSGVINASFAIPPRASEYPVHGAATIASQVKLIAAAPHMHLRGRSMKLDAVYSTGEREAVFDVPRYDFNWQQMYTLAKPLTLAKGSRLDMTATFDNSPNNPNNPDPGATVRWGDQTAEEMALAVVVLQIEPDQDLDALFEKPREEPGKVTAKNE